MEGKLYGTDEKLSPVDMVCKFFNSLSCPTLVGKPKLFLIQACRGEMFDYGVEATDSPFDRVREKDAAEKMAAEEMQLRQDQVGGNRWSGCSAVSRGRLCCCVSKLYVLCSFGPEDLRPPGHSQHHAPIHYPVKLLRYV